MRMLTKALQFSIEKMMGVKSRKDGTPAYLHPLRVAIGLASAGCSEETIIVGLLHDLIEDSAVSESDIAREFTQEIASLVVALSHEIGDPVQSTIDKVRNGGNDAVRVKLADNIDNIRTILSFKPEKRKTYLHYASRIQELAQEMIPTDILTYLHSVALQSATARVKNAESVS